ncbi:MAG: hypothetical protein ACR2QV_00190 [Gammaproteobacteria bacterium]
MLNSVYSNRKIPLAGLLTLMATLAVTPVHAGDDDVNPGWNARVEQDESKSRDAETTDTMKMRVFDDIDQRPGIDYPGRRRPGIAIDVESEIVTCADGYTRIDKLDVGGKQYEIDGDCAKRSEAPKISIDRAETPRTDARTDDQTDDR